MLLVPQDLPVQQDWVQLVPPDLQDQPVLLVVLLVLPVQLVLLVLQLVQLDQRVIQDQLV